MSQVIILHEGGIIVDVVHLAKVATEAGRTAAKIGAGVVTLFLEVALLAKPVETFEEAALAAVHEVRNAILRGDLVGDSGNADLFVAACDLDHGRSEEDEMTRRGWWHDKIFLSLERARGEAIAHNHTDRTVILHFQTAAPDIVEIIELSAL